MFKYSVYLAFLFFMISSFAQDETSDPVQLKLENGVSPKQLLKQGVKKSDLFGKMYQGGYIFYFFPDSTGLVIGPDYLSYPYDKTKNEIIWSCRGVVTKATSRKIGSGMANSIKIKEASCTLYDADERKWMYTAAEICLDYKGAGKTDWFLPSRDELHEAWLNLAKTHKVDFDNKLVWTSTEKDADFAWIQHFNQGERDYDLSGHSYYMKFYDYYVRPVRVFTN